MSNVCAIERKKKKKKKKEEEKIWLAIGINFTGRGGKDC
jgi:hypothetical protein